MARKKSRGGARRQMVPPVDQAHLEDSLVEHVKKMGVQSAFALGKYAKLEVQQAAVWKRKLLWNRQRHCGIIS